MAAFGAASARCKSGAGATASAGTLESGTSDGESERRCLDEGTFMEGISMVLRLWGPAAHFTIGGNGHVPMLGAPTGPADLSTFGSKLGQILLGLRAQPPPAGFGLVEQLAGCRYRAYGSTSPSGTH